MTEIEIEFELEKERFLVMSYEVVSNKKFEICLLEFEIKNRGLLFGRIL